MANTYRTIIAAKPIPKTPMTGSTIAAWADLTGATDVVELVLGRVVAEVVVDVKTVVGSWTVVVGDDDTSEKLEDEVEPVDDEVEPVSSTDVDIDVGEEVVLTPISSELLLVVAVISTSALLVVAAAAKLVVLSSVGATYQVGSTAYWLAQVGQAPSGASSPYMS